MGPAPEFNTWNYRIIRKDNGLGFVYQIHEVYYDEGGKITTWSEEPVAPMGETVRELDEDVRMQREAFEKPHLRLKYTDDGPALVRSQDDKSAFRIHIPLDIEGE